MRSTTIAAKIDFRFLKQEADFLTVLAHYHLEPVGRGVSRAILCPFHDDKTPSCKVNLGRKIFHCFGCGAHGNILDFVRMKENLAEGDLREAARRLAEICGIPLTSPTGGPAKRATKAGEKGSGAETMEEPSKGQAAIPEAP